MNLHFFVTAKNDFGDIVWRSHIFATNLMEARCKGRNDYAVTWVETLDRSYRLPHPNLVVFDARLIQD